MSLSVNQDLVANPLTMGTPDAVLIELLATLPNGGICNAAGPFQANPISELNKLTSTCAFIQLNGSGFGICGPCH